MNSILLLAGLALMITIVLAAVRALRGPTVFDRILAGNVIGTKTVLLAALIAMATGRSDFLDVALLYALANFVAVVAVLRYMSPRNEEQSPEDSP